MEYENDKIYSVFYPSMTDKVSGEILASEKEINAISMIIDIIKELRNNKLIPYGYTIKPDNMYKLYKSLSKLGFTKKEDYLNGHANEKIVSLVRVMDSMEKSLNEYESKFEAKVAIVDKKNIQMTIEDAVKMVENSSSLDSVLNIEKGYSR